MAILENLKNSEEKKLKTSLIVPTLTHVVFDLILLVFLLFHKLNLNLFV